MGTQTKIARAIRERGAHYVLRKQTVELVFGIIKSVMGFRQFLLRGLANVRNEWTLVCLAWTGVGKTWLACAFGSQVCRLRLPVDFFRASDLYGEIAVAAHDGSLPKLKADLIKPSLLIIDDFGLSEITPQAAQVLLDVVDRRMRKLQARRKMRKE